MFTIVEKRNLAPQVFLLVIDAPLVARKAQPGQFVIVRVSDDGERIPLTIADYNAPKGTVSLIVQAVGATTIQLCALEAGDMICDFVGPLGKPSEFHNVKRVLCVGGGVGTAVVYPQVKMLHAQGVKVDVVIGGRTRDLLILVDELRAVCDNLYLATNDGSAGVQGMVTDVVKQLLDNGEQYDEAVAIGPMIMMKVVCGLTREYGLKTMVSMNPIMVDGTGMCGGCRLTVGGKTVYACVDGPDFDGHQVDFDEAMRRAGMYKEEEAHQCNLLNKGGNGHGA